MESRVEERMLGRVHYLLCLKTWSPDVGAVWGGCRAFEMWGLTDQSSSLRPGPCCVPLLLVDPLCLGLPPGMYKLPPEAPVTEVDMFYLGFSFHGGTSCLLLFPPLPIHCPHFLSSLPFFFPSLSPLFLFLSFLLSFSFKFSRC